MCDLKIAGFELADDDFSFELSEIVSAINSTGLSISKEIIIHLHEKGYFNMDGGDYLLALAIDYGTRKEQNLKFRDYARIRKRDVIKLCDLIFKSDGNVDSIKLLTEPMNKDGMIPLKDIPKSIKEAKKPRVRMMLTAAQKFHDENGWYPYGRELFDMGKDVHGYDDWETFRKTFIRYFSEAG